VAGGTDESLALQQQAANDAMGDTMADIAANATDYKENIENQYRAKDAEFNEKQAKMEIAKGQAIAQAAAQVGSAVGGLASGMGMGSASASSIADTNAKIAEFDKTFSPTLQAPTLGKFKA
jgi:hypothetical protein